MSGPANLRSFAVLGELKTASTVQESAEKAGKPQVLLNLRRGRLNANART